MPRPRCSCCCYCLRRLRVQCTAISEHHRTLLAPSPSTFDGYVCLQDRLVLHWPPAHLSYMIIGVSWKKGSGRTQLRAASCKLQVTRVVIWSLCSTFQGCQVCLCPAATPERPLAHGHAEDQRRCGRSLMSRHLQLLLIPAYNHGFSGTHTTHATMLGGGRVTQNISGPLWRCGHPQLTVSN